MTSLFSATSALRCRIACSNCVAYCLGFLLLLVAIIKKTHGHFTYALDDAYIHLALAERIRHGLYGLNAGEPASPSSSLIWPLLFVPLVGTSLLVYAPLVLNLICGCAAAWLLGGIVDRYVAVDEQSTSTLWATRILGVFLLLATNIWGLTFIGLEHQLELVLCLSSGYLFVCAAEETDIPRWTIAAAMLLPLVRYEGLLVSLACAVVLWAKKRKQVSIAVVLAGGGALTLFAVFLHRIGLPYLPVSVLMKGAGVAATGGHLHRIASLLLTGLQNALLESNRLAGTVIALTLCTMTWVYRRVPSIRIVVCSLAAVACVQALLGPVGWLWRYEIYLYGLVLPVLLASQLGRWPTTLPFTMHPIAARPLPGLLFVVVGAFALAYLPAARAIPNAARSIWRQQGQLALLTQRFYTGPVAINDLGMVAQGRDSHQYVLDLAGLGSPEVYRLVTQHPLTAANLDQLISEHHIGLVAIYPEWFAALPSDWRPVAKLCTAQVQFGPGQARVMLFATPYTDSAALQNALIHFSATLPMGATIQFHPETPIENCNTSISGASAH